MIGRLFDSFLGVFAPRIQLRRAFARMTLAKMQAGTGHMGIDQLGAGGEGGYDAARRNRLTRANQPGSQSENSIGRPTIQQLRNSSWNLYRNNPHARKICRQLESKVVGSRGLIPMPGATKSDGTPHKAFRKRAREVWRRVGKQLDYRGRPGRGGQSFPELQKTALRGTILGGEVFSRFRRLSAKQQTERGLLLPTQIQLIHADRLDETKNDRNHYYGIQFNDRSERVAYHLLKYHPSDDRSDETTSMRVWASEILHLYMSEDIDQIRGTPWFGAALLKMRDVGDYEYNELQAAAMSACVVLGYRRSPGQTQFGVDSPSDWDLTDSDGNPITSISPGMILDLGQSGEIQGFNPQRPNANASEFINHMVRSEAAAVPGIKSSSLIGDYRQSSFSSERSADNDTWPEIEGLQDWLSGSFCQPVYEEVITQAVAEGMFDDVEGFSKTDFLRRKGEYLAAEWSGPVARSINPKDDAHASTLRMRAFTSSPQLEAALIGRSFSDILDDWEEFLAQAEERQLPEEAVLALMGVQVMEQDVDTTEDGDESSEGDTPGKDTKVKDHWQFRGMLNDGNKREEGSKAEEA